MMWWTTPAPGIECAKGAAQRDMFYHLTLSRRELVQHTHAGLLSMTCTESYHAATYIDAMFGSPVAARSIRNQKSDVRQHRYKG
jgi:hypothetical protein